MATIDQLDLQVYFQYARWTEYIENVNKEFRLKEAESIPAQTQVVDISPKLSHLDLLLGVAVFMTPWAYFLPPKKFNLQRRSPFSFSRVAPSLGSAEKQEADMARLAGEICQTKEEEVEKAVLLNCLGNLEKLNSLLSFIVGRIGQFLQG
jgi:hypothetical protein